MSDNLTRIRESMQRTRGGDASARGDLEQGLRDLSAGQFGDVLARWLEARHHGGSLSAEELCNGSLADVPTVAEVIRVVEDAQACLTATATNQSAPATDSHLPVVAGYELLTVLGRGGMGIVYTARQLGFNRIVALKMIRASVGDSPNERARFRIEAEAVARLRHPNIVQVFDIGEADGSPFFSMEYLEGGSLSRPARAEVPTPRRAAEIVAALARAMQHAHESSVIHRDLKPSNVLLDADGTPKVADFGLAKLLDSEATRTASEAILGTVCYLAPEQATAHKREVGPATDIYGLGTILYELLTGRPPVERGTWPQMLERVRTLDPPDPRRLRPDLNRDLEAICLKCLRKQPGQRYASARALADDLDRWLQGQPTVARPLNWAGRARRWAGRHPLAVAALVLVLLGAAAVPVVGYYRDPDRIPKDNLAQLERHQSVTLIGKTGPPRWSRWPVGEDPLFKSSDGTFTLSTNQYRLLELMPTLPAGGYRLHADVIHREALGRGEVGLYFAHSKHANESGEEEHTFGTLTFDDWAKKPAFGPAGTNAGLLKLCCRRCNTATGFYAETFALLRHPFKTGLEDQPPHNEWRRLALEVRSDRVEVFWEGASVKVVTFDEIAEEFGQLNKLLKLTQGMPPLHPVFVPQQGLGLFLLNASASFRNVRVDPL